jgi:octaprenyl-diphosphate synthase
VRAGPHSPFPVTPSVEALRAPIADDLAALDQLIRRKLESDVVLIRQVAEHIIASGGKRLRPLLVLLAARACGYEGSAHIELATVIEFIHTATLLHDDVVDESDLRRGRKTANANFGNAASVLVGDFLYSRSFQMVVDVGSIQVMRVLAEATNAIAEGEVLQLLNINNADTTLAAYLEVIRRKTAKLFEASGRLGAMLAGTDEQTELSLAQYGVHLGTAFQLVDDVLDYSGDPEQTGKNVGDDLREGKPTMPLIYAMHHGTPQEARLVRLAIEQGGDAALPELLVAMRRTNALEYTRAQASEEAGCARSLIATLRPSAYKDALLDLASFSAERSH